MDMVRKPNIEDARLGDAMHALARELFPICRSLTGDGVRRTLDILGRELPGLSVHEVASGTQCFDWTVPPEWNIRGAYIAGPDGAKIVDFKDSNLHVVGYSVPVDATMPLEELQPHLHSLPDQPRAVPYVTSYYREDWGFCLAHETRESLAPGDYRVVIDSTLAPGSLSYGELILPGDSDEEIFLSTYVCHPSLANNELSGPVVATYLGKWLQGLERRRYTYRIAFVPETIGAIVYLSRNLETMKARVRAGFMVTCVGDDRSHSYLPSRAGDTLADRVALHVLGHIAPGFTRHSYLARGSDERQYCSPGVDLPVASVMRTKYADYPEYHTSLDDLSMIPPAGLYGGFNALRRCIESLEADRVYRATVLGEPQLRRHGLDSAPRPDGRKADFAAMWNLIAYCDGTRGLLEIAGIIGEPAWELGPIAATLVDKGLLEETGAGG